MTDEIKQIADHYGLDSQLSMLQEECAELIQAISKYKRNRGNDIPKEMADVYIMLEQIRYLMGIENDVNRWIDVKIDRQLERMEDASREAL